LRVRPARNANSPAVRRQGPRPLVGPVLVQRDQLFVARVQGDFDLVEVTRRRSPPVWTVFVAGAVKENRRIDSAAAAKKCPRLSHRRTSSVPTSRKYARGPVPWPGGSGRASPAPTSPPPASAVQRRPRAGAFRRRGGRRSIADRTRVTSWIGGIAKLENSGERPHPILSGIRNHERSVGARRGEMARFPSRRQPMSVHPRGRNAVT